MSKKEKFKELAENRVKKALKLLKLIGNLANRTHYDYSTQDANKIISVLRSEVKNIETRFKSKNSTDDNDFKL